MPGTPPLDIRPALVADAPLILDFIRELADYEKLLHEVVGTVADIERWLFGSPALAEVLIAEWKGEAAGFALFFPNFSTFLTAPGIYLEDLFVRPRFRGHGIGGALLNRLARLVVDRGYKRLDWSVLDWNEPAIGFYDNIGAYPLDDWIRYRLDGEALSAMAKQESPV